MASSTHFPSHLSGNRRTRSDPHIIFIPHPHVGLSNLPRTPKPQPLLHDHPLDASMDKYKKQQRQHEWDLRRNPVDDDRITKMRKVTETAESNNHNHSNGTNLNFTSLSPHEKLRPRRGGGESRGRSHRPGFERQTLYRKSPNLSPRRSVDTKKLVNWRLACFMSKEYLTRGTLLGRAWPPQDSKNAKSPDTKSQAKSGSLDREADESKREKERLYYMLSDFLRAGDVHLPEIVNPSQLAAWLGIN